MAELQSSYDGVRHWPQGRANCLLVQMIASVCTRMVSLLLVEHKKVGRKLTAPCICHRVSRHQQMQINAICGQQ